MIYRAIAVALAISSIYVLASFFNTTATAPNLFSIEVGRNWTDLFAIFGVVGENSDLKGNLSSRLPLEIVTLVPTPTLVTTQKPQKPRIIYIVFGRNCCANSKQRACAQAMAIGPFTECHMLGFNDVDVEFQTKNEHILKHAKGGGYWAWKPYVIKKFYDQMGPNDVLYYGDSGSVVTKSIQPLVDFLWADKTGLLLFALCNQKVIQWTKRDLLIMTDTDSDKYYYKDQIFGTIVMVRKTETATHVLSKWLELAQDERAITDIPNQLGKPNLPEFKDHRHDQAILTCIAYHLDYQPYRDPTQWGEYCLSDYPNSTYPTLVLHSRDKSRRRTKTISEYL